MGFVGNYSPGGLSPQMYDMPVIPKKGDPTAVDLPLVVVWIDGLDEAGVRI